MSSLDNGSPSAPAKRIAIVGAGFSGTLQAINLLRHGGTHVVLIEQRETFAHGLAYSTGSPCHLLNVRAGNMSALPDHPDHFAEWLSREGRGIGQTFATRQEYGRYLAGLLHETVVGSEGRLRLRHGRVRGLRQRAGGTELELEDGGVIRADTVILALGNLPPHDPPELDTFRPAKGLYVADPWAEDFTAGLADDDTVLILGTGLTMVDVAMELEDQGFRGSIVGLSRRGLLPHAHRQTTLENGVAIGDKPSETGAALLRRVRRLARDVDWRAAVDALRPHAQAMWMAASKEERERFLRHLRPWWDIHRHRLAPPVAERIEAMRAEGHLEVVAGKIVELRAAGHHAEIAYRPRHGDAVRRLRVARIINCTSPGGDLGRSPDPLLRQLIEDGAIRPGPHRLGIDVNAQSEVIDASGTSNPSLLALGPLTRGSFWEIVSVPDIRVQAWSVARRLSNAHWVEGQGL